MQYTNKRLHAGLLALLFAAAPVTQSLGQNSLLASERLRRDADTQEAERLLFEGREAYASKDYEDAVRLYRESLNRLPFGPKTEPQRNEITAHLADGSVALSQQYRRIGKYDEAKGLLNDVLLVDPNRFEAQKSLEYFDDPIRTNPSLTEGHSQKVDEVRRLLYQGEGYFNLADFDKATSTFESVLRIDRYNKAARRWMERVNAQKSDYYRAAYDHTRSELLMEVDRAWELTVPSEAIAGDFVISNPSGDAGNKQTITNKLRSIIIPRIDFDDTSLEEAIEFLTQKSIELDPDPDPTNKGINFVIQRGSLNSAGGGGIDESLDGGSSLLSSDPSELSIGVLRLRNVPLATALDYVTNETGLRYRVDEAAVVLLPLNSTGSPDLITRTWLVPPTFETDLAGGGGESGGGASDDPFAPSGGSGGVNGGGLRPKQSMTEILQGSGVDFPSGSSARFISSSSSLIVKNTVSNLDLIDQIVDTIKNKTPKQIRILTKFVEVSQENTDELGFDWLITPFNLSNDFIPGGGTAGNAGSLVGSDFVNVAGNSLGIGGADTVIQNGTVTQGLRTGDFAIEGNSIDALLNNPNRTADVNVAAPGILSLTGLFTQGQVQLILRGLSQRRGTDIMTAPSVLARSGETATIEIIREFIYPTEFEPPELPNQVGGGIGGGGGILGGVGGGGGAGFPVTPATPTAFETRNTGVTLEIQPTIGANDLVIDLRFAPEIVEFEGFINYGSPITSPATDALGNPTNVTITENRIEMPVFASRRVNTGLTIFDGHTVAVGGLMREDVQRVEDKVPILGDLPFIGRLFQSNSESRIKSNLIIFVTAQIIDATGRPVNGNNGLDSPGLSGGEFSAPGSTSPGVLPPLPSN